MTPSGNRTRDLPAWGAVPQPTAPVVLVIQHPMHMRYIVICELSGCTVFVNFVSNLLNIKCGFCFPLQLLPEIFLILRRTGRNAIKKYALFFRYSARCSCRVLMEFEHLSTDCRKIELTEMRSKSVRWSSRTILVGF